MGAVALAFGRYSARPGCLDVFGSVCSAIASTLWCCSATLFPEEGFLDNFLRFLPGGSGFGSTTPFGGIRASRGLGIGPEARYSDSGFGVDFVLCLCLGVC